MTTTLEETLPTEHLVSAFRFEIRRTTAVIERLASALPTPPPPNGGLRHPELRRAA